MRNILVGFFLMSQIQINAQTVVDIYPDSLIELVNVNYRPGVFYVPKTEDGRDDFMLNDIYQNSIRTHIIESVLNNFTNLEDCLSMFESLETELIAISEKCQKLVFIFEKMPVWLSSSDDGSPATTPGWFVLNTKPPADWAEWQNVVQAITDKIVNDFGIDNAYFEVWNEPDIGSWTGTNLEYIELYKQTYDGIKAAGAEIKVGGPAVNYWANNIYWKPIPGHIPNAVADSSLIADLLVYGESVNRVPDFISWHNFSLTYQEFAIASNYVDHKCMSLGITPVEVLVSEWNVPSVIRDTPLAKSFMIKAQQEISQTRIANNMIAAWQDFSYDIEEFHHDYGLVTYGAIHKPAYNALKLSNQLKGAQCKVISPDPHVVLSAADGDTLCIIISNYCPPALQEAINKTLLEGEFNAKDLEDAGFIDLESGDFTTLISVYEEETFIPDSSPLNIAINGAIETYQFYDSVAVYPRSYQINLMDYSDDYESVVYLIGDETNNMHYRYDSLIAAGYGQDEAIVFIRENQHLIKTNQSFLSGINTITMAPNEVVLFKVGIVGVGELTKQQQGSKFMVYPNPSNSGFTIASQNTENHFQIFDLNGKLMQSIQFSGYTHDVNSSALAKGIYFIRDLNGSSAALKIVID